jgi:hypothetical protein
MKRPSTVSQPKPCFNETTGGEKFFFNFSLLSREGMNSVFSFNPSDMVSIKDKCADFVQNFLRSFGI